MANGGCTYDSAEDLAFAHWQYNANEKAYAAKLITRPVYEFARNEIQKSIDKLLEIFHIVPERAGADDGFN